MEERTTNQDVVIGMDLGDRYTEAAVLDGSGEVVETRRLRTSMADFGRAFSAYEGCKLIMEVGGTSPWASRLFTERGFEVVIANAAKVRAISASQQKNDRADAEMLARLGRLDTKLLYPVRHRGAGAQRDLTLVRQRDGLVQGRTQHINEVRGYCKSLGVPLPGCQAEAFVRRASEALRETPYPGFEETLKIIQSLNEGIASLDKQVEGLCEERYPETQNLRQIRGVGALTALCYVLTLEDPTRFKKSRQVGAYLGLSPRQRESGDRSPQLGISKSGDALLRKLLVNCGHYIIGPFGEDSDLRRHGLKQCERGGKAARKRAAIAVARKLAVVMHRLWLSGEDFIPLKNHPA